MLETHPVWMAAAWIVENVAHPQRLLLLVVGTGALVSFWASARIAQAKTREDVPAGDDVI